MTSKFLPMAALVCSLAACQAAPARVASQDPAIVAATISKALAANPAKSDSILAANHHTAASFTKVLFDIASDSASAEAYSVAMK